MSSISSSSFSEITIGSAITTSTLDHDDNGLPKVLIVNDVRITPGYMHFDNAYEGKFYEKIMVIQNCGTKTAFVRLCEPSSRTFQIKSFPEGINLCAGQKIKRKVTFTYRSTFGTQQALTTIWINGEEATYHFVVSLLKAVISVKPSQIDFGQVDAVNHATTRTFRIRNTGYKGTFFAIDLGRNPLELNVYPMKGPLPARTSVPISIEIVGSKEGTFVDQFWIKTDPPLRVTVSVTFVLPKLLVPNFVRKFDFTVMDFQPTYYGAAMAKTLTIKNVSSSHGMFCVMAEVKGVIMPLEEAQKIDDNYKNFIIKPIDGRVQALKAALIQVQFFPVKTRKKDKNYAACFLKVIHMDCRDIEEDVFINAPVLHPQFDYNSGELNSISGSIDTAYSVEIKEDIGNLSFEHSVGVCLYGEKELPGISFRPTEFHLSDLTLDQQYQRELLVVNKSEKLPIKVRYRKVASIDVKPLEFDVTPGGSTEVLVTIRTFKLDSVVINISFDLLYKDQNKIREVGRSHFKINFETTKVLAKSKFNKCVICKDTTEKLAPECPYQLKEEEQTKRIQNNEYYLNYIRSLKKTSDKTLQDYDVSKTKLLCLNTKYKNPPPLRVPTPEMPITTFIPLPPKLLYNIKISPKSIKLQKVTAYTTITNFFQIENKNSFPIRIFAKASKPCIVFDNNSRYIIASMEKKKITFNFSTNSIGKYFVNLSVIVNDSILYEVTVVAEVVPKVLKLETESIEFTENDNDYKFFKVINALNSQSKFTWEVQNDCFKIYPPSGEIQAERSLMCMVTCTPDLSQPLSCECTLIYESGHKKTLTVSYRKRIRSIGFDYYDIDTGEIPLNAEIKKKLVLRNFKKYPVFYTIPSEVSVPGITITPRKGKLDALDSQVFIITIQITAVLEFSANINFLIDEKDTYTVNVHGVVVYPSVVIRPDTLQFRKIALNSFDTLAFKMKNVSSCKTSITFLLEEYPEFKITECEDVLLPSLKNIVLHPQQSKVMFLHFCPYYISQSSLILPYIINDILGPVHINSSKTNNPLYFLGNQMTIYKEVKNVSLTPLPKLLSSMRFSFQATVKILTFSNLNINFVYYGKGHYNNAIRENFTICNSSTKTVLICIRTDHLKHPFALLPKAETKAVEIFEISYKIELAPNEEIVFQAEFNPLRPGHYSIKLPILIQGYFDNKIFNYLTLTGVYDQPVITPSLDRIDFEPVPLQLTNSVRLSLCLKNHFENCEIIFDSGMNSVYVVFDDTVDKKGKEESLQYVTLYLDTLNSRRFDTNVTFRCSCNACCNIPVTGVVENCLLTTHAFAQMLKKYDGQIKNSVDNRSYSVSLRPRYIDSLVNENTTCFPLFPADEDASVYGLYMRRVQKTLENWLFTQGFYMKSYYKIPEGFTNFCKINKPREEFLFGSLKKIKPVEPPIVELMVNFNGDKFRNHLPSCFPSLEDDENVWLSYICNVNCNTLQYLRGLGLYAPHVKTKYLLDYEGYLQYEKIKHPNVTPMESSTFSRLSKQCWIDLILQIIKIFFFKATVLEPDSDSKLFDSQQSVESHVSSEQLGEDILEIGIYGERETLLISWLQDIYNNEKNTLWDKPPNDKEIVYIDQDLRDGLILGVVTAYYCPYVQEEIKDMYTTPTKSEEREHNTYILINAWNMLKFSYIISPASILKSNMIEMLLLITYLYNILPTCMPTEEIIIEPPLTQTKETSIDLNNFGTDPIHYELVFFGNKNMLFSVSQKLVVVKPGSTRTVKIRYHAKTVQTNTTTLLFSGETPGQKYGRNLAVTLIGTADVSYTCMETSVTVDLYKHYKVDFSMQSPFKMSAKYNVFFGYEHISKDRNVLFPFTEVQNLKRFKEIIVAPDDVAHFDEDGKRKVTRSVCLQELGPRSLWFYYTNPEVGDWGVKLTLIGRVTDICFENIKVVLPENYANLRCTCKRRVKSLTKKCPKIIWVKVPMKNNLLWKARKTMMLEQVADEEYEFWSQLIFTPIGTRILKLLVDSETHPLRNRIEETVQYTPEIDPNLFVTLNKVTFEDVISEDFYFLPIHPLKDIEVDTCELHLTSSNKNEKRFYRLHFTRE